MPVKTFRSSSHLRDDLLNIVEVGLLAKVKIIIKSWLV